jgi:ankyrin repeat protein
MSPAVGFFDAIKTGDISRVEALLEADPALASAKDEKGVSAVLTSIYRNQRDIRDLLIAAGADLEIHDAAAAGRIDRVKHFVEKDPVLANAFSPDGFPIVALASVFGHFDVVRYLAEKGADLNAAATNGTGYNALTGAVTAGHTQIVRWLLESGANANYRYGPGYTPLLAAAANGHREIVRQLLEHGADPSVTSDDGKTALQIAEERNHPHVVTYLRQVAAATAGH